MLLNSFLYNEKKIHKITHSIFFIESIVLFAKLQETLKNKGGMLHVRLFIE